MCINDIVIVFDCGATNVRAIAINLKGEIIASESVQNNSSPDHYFPSYRIWDIPGIWDKICYCSKKVIAKAGAGNIAGITITTFGVDGTFFDRSGRMLYPVISWQCERTIPVMENIGKYIPVGELYNTTGVQPFCFNTINKLIWFIENKPDIIEKSYLFLFMPSIFIFLLTGVMINDMTMAGTSMLTDLKSRTFSDKILGKIGFPESKFGTPVEAGTIIGKVSKKAHSETLLPEGIPVVATGHDTQFALFGSGAETNQPVLSSGTWEVLMVRASGFRSGKNELDAGITTELDPVPGLYNIGSQWIASGILEWCRKTMYNDVKENVYDVMISGALKVPPGCNGVRVIPDFNKTLNEKAGGVITGLTMETTRDEIYRALLEALSNKLVLGKETLEKAGGFKSDSILCVGGGSKNKLWNRLRAEATGVPIKIIEHKETTVLGASLFVQAAIGNAATPEEARDGIDYKMDITEPG